MAMKIIFFTDSFAVYIAGGYQILIIEMLLPLLAEIPFLF